jgi:hypothetical protein
MTVVRAGERKVSVGVTREGGARCASLELERRLRESEHGRMQRIGTGTSASLGPFLATVTMLSPGWTGHESDTSLSEMFHAHLAPEPSRCEEPPRSGVRGSTAPLSMLAWIVATPAALAVTTSLVGVSPTQT